MAEPQTAERQQSTQGQTEQARQAAIDQAFQSQVGGMQGIETAREAYRAWFQLAEQTVRTAREVSELQTLTLMRHAIVEEVKRQVLAEMKTWQTSTS